MILLQSVALQLFADAATASDNRFEELKAKAEHGDANAQLSLGLCYATGTSVTKDEVEAVNWFRKAAVQSDAVAQFNLGLCYANGQGVATNEVEAAKWYRKAAEQNYSIAQYNLSFCYKDGRGMARDEGEALNWLRKAAEQGYTSAQYNLGNHYLTGLSVTKDPVEAVKWYRIAADHGLAQAQNNLAVCYESGNGIAKDPIEAVKWYHRAAGQGFANAQYGLGICYENGSGVQKDDVVAAKWYHKAAEQNLPVAQFNLAVCYATGRGLATNEVEAVQWYRKAAEQNLADAQDYMGICYFNGQGVAKDYVECYKWWLLAAGQGVERAKKVLTLLEDIISREQIAEGQKLARNFKPREVPSTEGDNSSTEVAQMRPESSGTGFFILEDGFLVTNEHVVRNAAQIRLVTSAGLISARLVKVDAANDLALLKAEGRFAALPVAASRGVKLGGTVATVGFPNIGLQGFAPKLAKGEIASLSGAQDDARYFQISVPVQPGNSGGALVDERGNVVGVVSAKLNARTALSATGALPENVNYAVKSSYLLSFLESVPEVSAKLMEPETKERKFEDVVKSAEQAAVLVLVY